MALLLILVTAYQICLKIWRSAYRDFKCDLRRTQWLRGIGWTGGVIWLLGLIASAIYIGTAFLTDTSTACQPDGSFRLSPGTYSMWSSSGFFQITLGGGHLTFAEAKVVDIVWDIGIGRGGQFILAFISWRVFVKYVTMCMEIEPVTYQLFRTIFIETEPSLPSTYRTIKSFIFQRRLRSRTAMTFMVVTMVFILAFPTLISAMSGYDANVGSHMRDRDDNLIPFQNFSRILYVVHDGWRINQDGNYWVTDVFYNPKSGDPVLGRSAICEGYYRHQNKTDCNLQNSVSEYVIAHGLGGRKNESTRFDNWTTGQNITLPAPALNITAYVSDDKRLGGQSSSGILEESWVRMNETFNITYIKENGTCQTMGDYQWGFSFLQLFCCLIFLIGWTIGLYIMWFRTHRAMKRRKRRTDDVSGEHRAVIELAATMQYELDIQDIDPSLLREETLKERVDKELRGGAISYAYAKIEVQADSSSKGRGSIKAWFRREKWWFSAIVFTSLLCSTIWMSSMYSAYGEPQGAMWFWAWCFGVWFGQFWAFCIGTTTGSRMLIILFWSAVAAIVVIICASINP